MPKNSHLITPNEHSSSNMVIVSINLELKVEKLKLEINFTK